MVIPVEMKDNICEVIHFSMTTVIIKVCFVHEHVVETPIK